jgi:hypothetical protein
MSINLTISSGVISFSRPFTTTSNQSVVVTGETSFTSNGQIAIYLDNVVQVNNELSLSAGTLVGSVSLSSTVISYWFKTLNVKRKRILVAIWQDGVVVATGATDLWDIDYEEMSTSSSSESSSSESLGESQSSTSESTEILPGYLTVTRTTEPAPDYDFSGYYTKVNSKQWNSGERWLQWEGFGDGTKWQLNGYGPIIYPKQGTETSLPFGLYVADAGGTVNTSTYMVQYGYVESSSVSSESGTSTPPAFDDYLILSGGTGYNIPQGTYTKQYWEIVSDFAWQSGNSGFWIYPAGGTAYYITEYGVANYYEHDELTGTYTDMGGTATWAPAVVNYWGS